MAVKRNIVANYLGQAATGLLGIIFVPVYIHYLTIEAYGLVGLFAVVGVWLSLLDLGMAPTLGREMSRFSAGVVTVQSIRDLLRSLEIVVGAIGMLIVAVMFVAAPFLSVHWLNTRLPTGTVVVSLEIMALVVGLRFCEGIYRSALMGLQQQVWLNGASVALAVVRTAGAIFVIALVSKTIEAFFLWQAVISLASLALVASKLHFSLPPAPRRASFSTAELSRVRSFAGGMFATTILAVTLTQADKLLLSRLLTLSDFGFYMLAAAIAGTLYMVVGPVTSAIYPVFVRLVSSDDQPRLARAYHESSQFISVMLAPVVAMLAAYPHAVLYVWSNDDGLARRTAPLLAVLALGTFLNGLMNIPHQLQLAYAWTRLSIGSNIIAVVALIPALFWAVPRYGPIAAAAIWFVLNFTYLVVQMPMMHRRLLRGELRRWYLADVGMPVLGAVLVIAVATVVMPDAPGSRIGWFVRLAVIGATTLAGSVSMTADIRKRLFDALQVVASRRRERFRQRVPLDQGRQ
ncbi:MAG: lipopolysaccharide biosynthesis protein [Janthinobacterium lividum]